MKTNTNTERETTVNKNRTEDNFLYLDSKIQWRLHNGDYTMEITQWMLKKRTTKTCPDFAEQKHPDVAEFILCSQTF